MCMSNTKTISPPRKIRIKFRQNKNIFHKSPHKARAFYKWERIRILTNRQGCQERQGRKINGQHICSIYPGVGNSPAPDGRRRRYRKQRMNRVPFLNNPRFLFPKAAQTDKFGCAGYCQIRMLFALAVDKLIGSICQLIDVKFLH